MKRSTIAATALLALFAAVLAGCGTYEYQYFKLEKAKVKEQPDGTWIHVSILPSRYVDEEKLLIRERDPLQNPFRRLGRFRDYRFNRGLVRAERGENPLPG